MDMPPWGFGPPPSGLEFALGGRPDDDDDDGMPVDVEQLLASLLPQSMGQIEAFAQMQGMRRAKPGDRSQLDHLIDRHAYVEPQPDEQVADTCVTTTRAGRSRLAKRKFDLEDVKDKVNCPICLDPRDPGCEALRMPCCGQRFHRACAVKWLTKESDKCPTCRATLEKTEAKRDYSKLSPTELRLRCAERGVETKGIKDKALLKLLKDDADADDARRARPSPFAGPGIFLGVGPPPGGPGAALAFPPFMFGGGPPPFMVGGPGAPPRRRGRAAAPAPAPARRRGAAGPGRARATGGTAPRAVGMMPMGFPFTGGGAPGQAPAPDFLMNLFNQVRQNVRAAGAAGAAGARGGPGGPPMARLGFPVGGPGGLQFQVHIGGPPPGVAEDEDLMEVPSPREPPARRRRREAPSPREEPPARRRRSS